MATLGVFHFCITTLRLELRKSYRAARLEHHHEACATATAASASVRRATQFMLVWFVCARTVRRACCSVCACVFVSRSVCRWFVQG